MAVIDLGLILPRQGTLIYTDNVTMNYNIPDTSQLSGVHQLFSVISEESEESEDGE